MPERYIVTAYGGERTGSDSHRPRHPRDAEARQAHRGRDQADRGRLDALFLGRQLRPDLSGGQTARGAPAGREHGPAAPRERPRPGADLLARGGGAPRRRARRIVIAVVVLAVVAGAIGSGVAKRLGPYSAKDPASESIKATNRLTKVTGLDQEQVVALIRLRAPAGSPQGRAQIAQVARKLTPDRAHGRLVTPFPPPRAARGSPRAGRPAFPAARLH